MNSTLQWGSYVIFARFTRVAIIIFLVIFVLIGAYLITAKYVSRYALDKAEETFRAQNKDKKIEIISTQDMQMVRKDHKEYIDVRILYQLEGKENIERISVVYDEKTQEYTVNSPKNFQLGGQ